WLLAADGVPDPLFPSSAKVRLAITLLTHGFAVILCWLLVRRYVINVRTNSVSQAEWFIVLCGAAAFGLQLIFVWFCDVYLIPFVALTAFALSRMAGNWPRWMQLVTTALCLIALTISSFWTRANLTQAEAKWRAAEIARAAQPDSHD